MLLTSLVVLASKLVSYLETELDALDIGDEWTEVPDLYAMIQKVIFTVSTAPLCGPHFFALNSNFIDEFWAFDAVVYKCFSKAFHVGSLPNHTGSEINARPPS